MMNFLIAALLTFVPLQISTNEQQSPAVKPPMKTEEMKKQAEGPIPTPPHEAHKTAPHEEITFETMFVKMILVLVSLLVMVAFCVWLFKRMNHSRLSQMNYHKTIKILETRPISPKTLLYLVEVGDRRILLSESQLDVRQLTTLEFPEENHIP
jgi:flagellar biosynthetic protein FliO